LKDSVRDYGFLSSVVIVRKVGLNITCLLFSQKENAGYSNG